MFKGSYVAMVTPFKKGEIDKDKVKELVEFHIQKGTTGILSCGCTGEAATLTHDEQKEMIKLVVDTASGRVPVLAGTGSNNTAEAVDLTKYAASVGANGALLITPYYNKPTPEGQYLHYKKVADEVGIPIMLYNVPSRTGVNMLASTVARLSEVDNIAAIKEAGGSVDQVSNILSLCDITVLSGDDSLTLPMMSVGAVGVVSVVANVVPDKVIAMIDSFNNGDLEKAKQIHYELLPICKAMFIETNPIPVKTAMSMMGMIEKEWRLPLCEMSPDNEKKLKETLLENKIL